MKFKVGDRVKVVGGLSNNHEVEGMVATIRKVDASRKGRHGEYELEFDNGKYTGSWKYDNDLILIKHTMNLKERMALVFKGEPEKTFIKAGITDISDELTKEGWEVFGTWLLRKHGAEFKKEVVDPILAEEEANK